MVKLAGKAAQASKQVLKKMDDIQKELREAQEAEDELKRGPRATKTAPRAVSGRRVCSGDSWNQGKMQKSNMPWGLAQAKK